MREDPRLEERLLDRIPGEKRFFGITGAGCTLLALAPRADLTALVGDPNVSIHEGKAFVCGVEKADA